MARRGGAARTNALRLPGAVQSGGSRPSGSAVRLAAGRAVSMVHSGVNQAALLWTRTGHGGGRSNLNSQPYSFRGRRR